MTQIYEKLLQVPSEAVDAPIAPPVRADIHAHADQWFPAEQRQHFLDAEASRLQTFRGSYCHCSPSRAMLLAPPRTLGATVSAVIAWAAVLALIWWTVLG